MDYNRDAIWRIFKAMRGESRDMAHYADVLEAYIEELEREVRSTMLGEILALRAENARLRRQVAARS